jgi:hypothetical protein
MKIRSLTLAVSGTLLIVGGWWVAVGIAGPSDHGSPTAGHVTICHHTGDKARPFIVISPDASGVYDGHAGLHHQYGDDIIPAFSYVDAHGQTVSFPGQNLTTLYDGVTGATLLANGCVAPQGTTTTIITTTTTTPGTTTTIITTTTTGGTTTVQAPPTTTGAVAGTTTSLSGVTTTSAPTTAGATTTSPTTTAATTTGATTTGPFTPPTAKPTVKPKPRHAAKPRSPGVFKPPKSKSGGPTTSKLAFTP